jgi:DeoR family suf operon transcriptional repressor
MPAEIVTSDQTLLDLLRSNGPMSVAELRTAMKVTATAVRQRLVRLLGRGDIQRHAERLTRGRPAHRYALTDQGRRRSAANFTDLAMALWHEVREIKDPEVRRGLLQRISGRLAKLYAGQVRGSSIEEKMESLAEMFRERQIPIEVDRSRELPLLRATACPYPDLAEQDRTVCSMERIMFSELLGTNVRLSDCRLDGHNCCTFEPVSGASFHPAAS